jgi:hypothetical protein
MWSLEDALVCYGLILGILPLCIAQGWNQQSLVIRIKSLQAVIENDRHARARSISRVKRRSCFHAVPRVLK